MTGPDVTTSFARTLVDEWVRAGITHAVVSPGSRNTPLVLALARDGRLRLDVVLDERSAAFRALGAGLATGRPAIVCCTSGTAAANMHPAVIEAHHARVPLLVCTADRPPELRDWGAGQTIDQAHLFGRAVRWYHDPGPPVDRRGAGGQWRALAGRAVAEALGPPPGPVHLNLPFEEPLVPTGAPLVDDPGRADGQPWIRATRVHAEASPNDIAALAELVRAQSARPRGCRMGRGRGTVDRDPLRGGGRMAGARRSRVAAAHGSPDGVDLRSAASVRANSRRHTGRTSCSVWARRSPARSRIPGSTSTCRRWSSTRTARGSTRSVRRRTTSPRTQAASLRRSRACSARNGRRLRGSRAGPPPSAGRVPRSIACSTIATRRSRDRWRGTSRPRFPTVARSWLPRACRCARSSGAWPRVPACACSRIGVPTASTASCRRLRASPPRTTACRPLRCAAICASCTTPTVCCTRIGRQRRRIVVIDNDGGGIFSYLPQHDLPEFEALFATPSGIDLVAVARARGVTAERIDGRAKWHELITGGPDVVVVPVDREASVAHHRRMWDAAATAIAD